jgi:acetolactate synthase small subunit
MNDHIDHAREKLIETRQKSIDTIRLHYTRLIDELRCAQITNEEIVERQSTICNNELELLINEHKQRCEQIYKTIQDLRTTITDWSTIEQFKQLQLKLTHIQEDIHEANEIFHERLPEMEIFQFDNNEHQKKNYNKHVDSPSQTDELVIINCKQNLMASAGSTRNHHQDGM